MKTFKRQAPRAPSKFAQFIRFAMLGVCLGCGVMILKLATFSQLSMHLAFGLKMNHWLAAIVIQLCEWSDVLFLAPAAAYVAGRIFMSNKWKFVVSLFVGIQLFPIAIIFADGAGISSVELGLRIATVVFGIALSLLTFGRGVRAALAQEQLPAGASPTAPQPLPQPLSQIDFTAVSQDLQKDRQSAASPSPAAAAQDLPEGQQGAAVPPASPAAAPSAEAAANGDGGSSTQQAS